MSAEYLLRTHLTLEQCEILFLRGVKWITTTKIHCWSHLAKKQRVGIFMLGDAAFMQGEMMYGEIETFRLAHVVQ